MKSEGFIDLFSLKAARVSRYFLRSRDFSRSLYTLINTVHTPDRLDFSSTAGQLVQFAGLD